MHLPQGIAEIRRRATRENQGYNTFSVQSHCPFRNKKFHLAARVWWVTGVRKQVLLQAGRARRGRAGWSLWQKWNQRREGAVRPDPELVVTAETQCFCPFCR